jgi:hypothetical protein
MGQHNAFQDEQERSSSAGAISHRSPQTHMLYDVTEAPFSVKWGSVGDVAVSIRPLKHADLSPRTLREWSKGKVINSKDLKRFLARETTLVLKKGSRILGVVNIREPFSKEMLYPEVVGVESNPKTRDKIKGVGSALMAASVIVSKNWGYRGAIQLVANQQAIEFYKKIGMSNIKKGQSSNKFYFTARSANKFLRRYEQQQYNKILKLNHREDEKIPQQQQQRLQSRKEP